MIRRPPRSTQSRSSAASDVYKRQVHRKIVVPYGSAGLRQRTIRQFHDRLRRRYIHHREISSASSGHQAAHAGPRAGFLRGDIVGDRTTTSDRVQVRDVRRADRRITSGNPDRSNRQAPAGNRRPVRRFQLVRRTRVRRAVNDTEPEPVDTTSVCLLYTSPSPRDGLLSRMPSSA